MRSRSNSYSPKERKHKKRKHKSLISDDDEKRKYKNDAKFEKDFVKKKRRRKDEYSYNQEFYNDEIEKKNSKLYDIEDERLSKSTRLKDEDIKHSDSYDSQKHKEKYFENRTVHKKNRHHRHSSNEEIDDLDHHRKKKKNNREDEEYRHSNSNQNEFYHRKERLRDHNKTGRERNDFHQHRKENTSKWDQTNHSNNYEREFGRQDTDSVKGKDTKKEEPNFQLSGKLTEYTNTYNGVTILYNEPTEARKPKTRWRLYPFKGDTSLPLLQLHRQSAFLLGRDRKIADIPVDHPSCSKQHAVLQFRLVEYERPDGAMGRKVKPYIIDLDSTNGTYVNNKRIDTRCYVELIEKDVLKFGFSSREYVILHEKSKDDEAFSDDQGEDKNVPDNKDNS